MAKTETRNKTEAQVDAEVNEGGPVNPPVDGEEGLRKLADLTRRVIAVPKDEVPTVFAKPKKRANKKRT